MRHVGLLLALPWALMGCGSSDAVPPSDDDGEPVVTCAAWETETAEGCLPPGVPPDGCAEGFGHDGGVGCVPVLPDAPCPAGLMAVPGDAACRPVMDCGQGTWGDIPLEGTVVFVDAQAAGGGDGSMNAPVTTIQAAVGLAPPGATIAIAEGTYVESLLLDGPVKLWGRCPTLVELRNIPGNQVAVRFGSGASGSEIHGVAVSADGGFSIVSNGAAGVLLDRIWVHDQPLARGPLVQHVGGVPADMTIMDSLIEGAFATSVSTFGAHLRLERSEIRDAVYAPSSQFGAVLLADPLEGLFATVEVVGSRLSRGDGVTVLLRDAEAIIQGSVLEQNQVNLASFGTTVETTSPDPTMHRARLDLVQSVVRDNVGGGINLAGSDATIDRTTIVRSLPQPTGRLGRSVSLQRHLGAPAQATLIDSAFAASFDVSLFAAGSTIVADRVAVLDTSARPSDLTGGRAVSIQPVDEVPSILELRHSTLDRSEDQGIAVIGSSAVVEDTAISDTRPRPSDGAYGDGITVTHELQSPGGATLARLLVRNSSRAGLALFGAQSTLVDTTLECNAVQIHGDLRNGVDYALDNLGGNVCRCGDAEDTCKVLTVDLAPPDPL